ncbi:hypothetical protein EYF80_012487 [Liparis tanakae]|uniref:Uncharacterized protein n=1 Tax=Liparis tanakae TaxID=230148 RepID=A0A4Z2IIT5_9TELE|nr:hypothetical protein EYF80_012487 [Liparis tanakae]
MATDCVYVFSFSETEQRIFSVDVEMCFTEQEIIDPFFKSGHSYITNSTCLTIYFGDLLVVETRGTRRERASKANKDRWCMQQRYRGEEAGGGGGGGNGE